MVYDARTGEEIRTVQLPWYSNMLPAHEYRGLAYDDEGQRIIYCRSYQAMTPQPGAPPLTTKVYLTDVSGRPICDFAIDGHYIVGLALDTDHGHLFCIARGNTDMLFEYDVSRLATSNQRPKLLQGPLPVPWSRPTSWGAAGLNYDEEQDLVVAVNCDEAGGTRPCTKEWFRDVDPDYVGPLRPVSRESSFSAHVTSPTPLRRAGSHSSERATTSSRA